MSLYNILVSPFKLNYWNKLTFAPHCNFSGFTEGLVLTLTHSLKLLKRNPVAWIYMCKPSPKIKAHMWKILWELLKVTERIGSCNNLLPCWKHRCTRLKLSNLNNQNKTLYDQLSDDWQVSVRLLRHLPTYDTPLIMVCCDQQMSLIWSDLIKIP